MSTARQVEHDVIIIGGGPSGSTAGAILARSGKRVLILERENWPDFRIGESLLPNGNEIFRESGVWPVIESTGFVRKYGAEFETSDGRRRVHNVFANGMVKGLDYTYQVDRPRFDRLLLDHAVACGCSLQKGIQLADIRDENGAWTLATRGGPDLRSRWLIDAGGRGCFLGRKFRLPKDPTPYPPRIAVYNHFLGARRREGPEGGNIIITRLRDGWFWQIPISQEHTSVGLVTPVEAFRSSGLDPARWFQSRAQASSAVSGRLADAVAINDYRTVTDYSHMFSEFCGPRFFLVGDAATFTDPIFSSGVYLGLESARAAARAILRAEQSGTARLSRLRQAAYTRNLKQRTAVVRKLIDTFYADSGFAVFMNPTDRFQLFAAVNSIVAGKTCLGFSLRWRYAVFLMVCRANLNYRLVPSVRSSLS